MLVLSTYITDIPLLWGNSIAAIKLLHGKIPFLRKWLQISRFVKTTKRILYQTQSSTVYLSAKFVCRRILLRSYDKNAVYRSMATYACSWENIAETNLFFLLSKNFYRLSFLPHLSRIRTVFSFVYFFLV